MSPDGAPVLPRWHGMRLSPHLALLDQVEQTVDDSERGKNEVMQAAVHAQEVRRKKCILKKRLPILHARTMGGFPCLSSMEELIV